MTSEPVLDHRARLERDRLESEHRRSQARIDQSSTANSPAERIRVWERLHQLQLPKDPEHPILAHVARATALRLDEVKAVQQARNDAQPASAP